ncbi:hypothetical protein M9458_010617, partial [Cirrhinus mrigala]
AVYDCLVMIKETGYEPSAYPVMAAEAAVNLSVLFVIVRSALLWWSSDLPWSSASSWGFLNPSALLWWLSAPQWGALDLSAWCSSAPPTPLWRSSALHWWASAPLWWFSAPLWRSSVPLWWSSTPSWLSVPPTPPWLVASPAPPWLSAPLALPWLFALPQFLVPPLLYGPGPLSLPLFHLLDFILFGAGV